VEILYFMVPLGLILVALGLWGFFWAVGSGQFDDLDSPGWTVLSDEEKKRIQAPGTGDAGAPAASGEPPKEPPQ
jgi:cbb3-type cytochrome oxidase maturation protein